MTTDTTNMIMPVAPTGGFGGGFGDMGSGWWIILLFVLLGGFGGGYGYGGGFGGNDIYPWMNQSNQISDGFRDQMLNSNITGIQNGINAIGPQLCNGFAGVTAAVTNGFAQAEIAANARQMADMQQTFAMQTQFSDCCCENRLASCQTQNAIATEGAATRAAIQSGVQSVLDKMCQDKIDEKNEKIVELQNRLNMADFAASQASQNNYLQNALTAQTQYFLSLYPPTAPTATATTTNG